MKAAAVAVGILLLLGLTGCGGEDGPSTTTVSTGTTAAGDVAAGREVFISTGCGSCHTLSEAGTTGPTGPNLDEGLVPSAEAAGAPLVEHVRTSIVNPDAWVMPQFSGGVMPTNYESELSDEELDDLVAFLVDAADQPETP
jgi:mono/diheme cytochrome c family protein